ncbi:MAG: DUF952 domain-containing protein [Acidobacteria bacterium]|nr:DUF952 domain-containing protein [Acidobacteriota bacterium]
MPTSAATTTIPSRPRTDALRDIGESYLPPCAEGSGVTSVRARLPLRPFRNRERGTGGERPVRRIFHITTREALAAARARGSYRAPSLETEGFVHCSYPEMLPEVAERFFRAVPDLVLLEIEPARLGDAVRDEPVPEIAARFPHVYGEIPLSAVVEVHPFASDDGGRFRAPDVEGDDAARDRLLAAYDWYDHPEGPKFVETHRDDRRSCGHWLFLPGSISAFHQVLDGDELWLIHLGALLVYVISADGALVTERLGLDFEKGERPVVSVPVGAWQAAELAPGATLAFGSNVCAPPFAFEAWRLTPREELLRRFPRHGELVRRLSAPD